MIAEVITPEMFAPSASPRMKEFGLSLLTNNHKDIYKMKTSSK